MSDAFRSIMRSPGGTSDGPGGVPPSSGSGAPGGVDDSYLWDKSGTPDPDVVRLEGLLAGARLKAGAAPVVDEGVGGGRVHVASRRGSEERGKRRKNAWMLPAFGTLALFALIAWVAWPSRPWAIKLSDWKAEAIAGVPTLNEGPVSKPRSVSYSAWMETDPNATLRLSASSIGTVIVDPNSRVRINEVKPGEHWFELAQGRIQATIHAPPKLFFVQTPAALAVDMGCAYTLEVDGQGAGTLHVTAGWVELQGTAQVVRVPRGYKCAIRPGRGPGTPFDEHSSDFLIAAVERFDLRDPKVATKMDVVGDILAAAGGKSLSSDAVLLWHLLRAVEAGDRERVYAHLAAIVPPPAGITVASIVKLDPVALDQWWDVIRFR